MQQICFKQIPQRLNYAVGPSASNKKKTNEGSRWGNPGKLPTRPTSNITFYSNWLTIYGCVGFADFLCFSSTSSLRFYFSFYSPAHFLESTTAPRIHMYWDADSTCCKWEQDEATSMYWWSIFKCCASPDRAPHLLLHQTGLQNSFKRAVVRRWSSRSHGLVLKKSMDKIKEMQDKFITIVFKG